MQEIKNITDLEKFGGQVENTRSKLKKTPSGFFLFGGLSAAYDKLKDENNKLYSDSLPKEVPISNEMSALLVNMFVDYLQAQEDLNSKFEPGFLKKILKSADILFNTVFPSPLTVVSILSNAGESYANANDYGKAFQELLRRTNKNMLQVLGSYHLTKKPNGDYVLKVGEWDIERWTEIVGMGAIYHTEFIIKDVGIDKSLLPADKQHLVEKYKNDFKQSPNIGRL